jgi:hypothetical protein
VKATSRVLEYASTSWPRPTSNQDRQKVEGKLISLSYVIKVMSDKERRDRVPLVRENQKLSLASLLNDINLLALVILISYHVSTGLKVNTGNCYSK